MSCWFAVQCVFVVEAGSVVPERGQAYEERVTLWQAADADEAMSRARAEAEKYATEAGFELVTYMTAYELYEPPKDGVEVWSLMRDSWLPPKDYVDRFVRRGDPHAVPYEE